MRKITFTQLKDMFYEYNKQLLSEAKSPENHTLAAVIVYKQDNWPNKNYTLEERSYAVYSDDNYFVPGRISNSYCGDSLDGTDPGVRLDRANWDPEYCYLPEKTYIITGKNTQNLIAILQYHGDKSDESMKEFIDFWKEKWLEEDYGEDQKTYLLGKLRDRFTEQEMTIIVPENTVEINI